MRQNFQVRIFKSLSGDENERIEHLTIKYYFFLEILRLYKKLLNEKKAIETVLRENTHLDGLSDVESFEAHLRNLNIKNEVYIIILVIIFGNFWYLKKFFFS